MPFIPRLHKQVKKPPPQKKKDSYSSDSSGSSGGSSDDSISDTSDEGSSGYKPGGYHPVNIGDVYNDKYLILMKLGWGHFSTVWLVEDKTNKQKYALKIQKSHEDYTEAALDEVKLLKCIDSAAEKEKVTRTTIPIVRLVDSFKIAGPNGNHVCFLFDLMGISLFELSKLYNYNPISINIIRPIFYDMLKALEFLHSSCKIIHTDIKPENILLSYPLPVYKKPYERPNNDFYKLIGYEDPTTTIPDCPQINELNTQLLTSSDNKEQTKIKNKIKKIKKKLTDNKEDKFVPNCPTIVINNFSDSFPEFTQKEFNVSPEIEFLYPDDYFYIKFHFIAPLLAIKEILGISSEYKWIFSFKKYLAQITLETVPDAPEFELAKHMLYNEELIKYNLFSIRTDVSIVMSLLRRIESCIKGLFFLHVPDKNTESFEHKLYKKVTHLCYLPETSSFNKFDGHIFGIYISPNSKITGVKPFKERFHDFPDDFNEQIVISSPHYFSLDDPIHCKLVDLGNACWTTKHFSSIIQTRQYRSPEVIFGQFYDTSADIWSLACTIYELITGNLLFKPKSGSSFDRDFDHILQIINVCGYPPKYLLSDGKYVRDFFNTKGQLRYGYERKPFKLYNELRNKYSLSDTDSSELENLLLSMLQWDPSKRASATKCLEHPFIKKYIPS